MKSFAEYNALSEELSQETVDDLTNLKLTVVNDPSIPSIKAGHNDSFYLTHLEPEGTDHHDRLLHHFGILYKELAFRVEQLAMEQFKGFHVAADFADKVSKVNVDIIRDILNGSPEYRDSLSETKIHNLALESKVMIDLQNYFIIFADDQDNEKAASTITVNVYVNRCDRQGNNFVVTKVLAKAFI